MSKDESSINKFNEKRYASEMPVDKFDKTRIDFILKNIPEKDVKVLDIGCWDGSYASRYKKKGNKIFGIENSESAAKKASKKGITVKHGDFMKINPFKNEKFDVVVAGEIIEHVFDTDQFIDKIKSLLNDGGKVIITTPNVASLPRRILLLFGINPILENRVITDEKVGALTAGHIRYFTFSDIYKLLSDHGFEILSSKSDILNFNNNGTLYSTLIPKIFKHFGKTIMVVAKKAST